MNFGFFFKTEVDIIREDATMFSTSTTLNERFSIRKPCCVFIINKGYPKHYENNKFSGRVVIENPLDMKINQRFTSYGESFSVQEAEILESCSNWRLSESAKRRHVFLRSNQGNDESLFNSFDKDCMAVLPTHFDKADVFTTESAITLPKVREISNQNRRVVQPQMPKKKLFKRRKDRAKRARNNKKLNPSASKMNSDCNRSSEPIVYSQFMCNSSPYYRRSLYKWRGQPPPIKPKFAKSTKSRKLTKEALDDELDKYMSEVEFKAQTSAPEDIDSYVEEYEREAEKCLKNYDDDFGLVA